MRSHSRATHILSILVLGALSCTVAGAMVRIGGSDLPGSQAVRVHDVRNPQLPVVSDRTEDLAESGSFAVLHDELFVAAGSEVRLYNRESLGKSPLATWSAGGPILSLAEGTERGLVLVLDRTSLRLVRFPESEPASVVWSFPVDESALASEAGRLVVRDGSQAYVADASLPGVRVLSIDPTEPPSILASYDSLEGPVHDIVLWNRTLSLLTEGALVLVDAGEPETPTFRWLGTYATSGRPSTADLNTRRAFVTVGSNAIVLDIDPSSGNFLSAPLDSWTAPGAIRSVSLDKADRAYLLLDGSYEILDVSPYGGK